MTRIAKELGLEVPLRRLFETPTVADLAALVEQSRAGAVEEWTPIPRVARAGRLAASFAQERLWFLDRLVPDVAAYNVLTVARLRGALDAAALGRALTEIVRRHEPLRTVFRDDALGVAQVVLPAEPVALPVVDPGGTPEAGREERARGAGEDE